MAGQFEPTGDGGAALPLDEVEISILRSLAVQLLELIGPGDEPAVGDDPLAALFTEGPSEPPSDPALARLFPDAYGPGPDAYDSGRDPYGPGREGESGQNGEGRGETEARKASAEFRRFTEPELRDRKRQDGLAVVRALDALGSDPAAGRKGRKARGGAVLTLRPEESKQWLGALNDLRLAIGTRLEVSDDEGRLYALPDDDPRKPMVMAYLWLGGLQESLIETL